MFIRRIFVVVLICGAFLSNAQIKKPNFHTGYVPLSSSCIVTDLPPDKPDTAFILHPEPDEPGERDPLLFLRKRRLPNRSWSNYFEDLNPGGLNKTNAGDMALGIQKKFTVYTQGTPPDNTIAISNDGKIVASINVKIGFYDSTGTRLMPTDINIATFLNDPQISQVSLFDPRLIYDPKADRFIYVVMSGNTDVASKLVVGFSQTNDPLGAWKFYKFKGNFDGSPSWFDYPIIAVTDNELIITGNLFFNPPGNSFNQAVIVQINKADGYNGAAALNYKSWDNIADATGNFALSIVPAIHGTSENYGPNIYFISNTPPGGTLLSFYEITNLWNVASSQLIIKAINVDLYSTAPNDARQKGTSRGLDVMKNRIRFAYYSNGILHYTYITPTNTSGTLPAVVYGRYDIATQFNKIIYVGASGFNFAYPAIMHFSNLESKEVTLLTYLVSNNTIFPELRAVTIDEKMIPSASIIVKPGEGFVNYGFGPNERWGDYTGVAKKYNSIKPEVWVFGCYGELSHLWGNYIAQITAQPDIKPPVSSSTDTFYLFPNPVNLSDPVYEKSHLQLYVSTSDTATFQLKIYSIKGQLVRDESAVIPKGKHLKAFDLIGLSPEEYIIKLSKNDTEFKPTKIVIVR